MKVVWCTGSSLDLRRPQPVWMQGVSSSLFVGGLGSFVFLSPETGGVVSELAEPGTQPGCDLFPWTQARLLSNRRRGLHEVYAVSVRGELGAFVDVKCERIPKEARPPTVKSTCPSAGWAWILWTTSMPDYTIVGQHLACIDDTGVARWEQTRSSDWISYVAGLSDGRSLVASSANRRVELLSAAGESLDVAALPAPAGRLGCKENGMLFFARCRDVGLVVGTITPLANVRPFPDPDLRWGFAAVRGDQLYVMATGWVAALNEDLTCRFKTPCQLRDEDNQIQSPPCFLGDRMYVGSNNGSLWCYDCRTGELLDRLEFPRLIPESPATDGEHIFVGCGDGKVYCVQP